MNTVKISQNKKGMKSFQRSGKRFAWLMISVAVVHFAVFWIYINFDQFRMAFSYRTVSGAEILTLDNFRRIFREFGQTDSVIVYSLVNTLKYWLMSVGKLILTVFVAYFLWKKIPFSKTFLFVFFLPSILPPVMMVTLFKNMISTVGPIAALCKNLFGVEIPPLLMHYTTATDTIIFYTFWAGLGINMLILLGAFGRIPDSVIDAGKIDGCGWLREIWSITVPLIWETVQVMLLLNISSLFIASGPILLFTNGNEYTKTYTISFWMYVEVQKGNFYYPAAVGLFFTLLALPPVFISRFVLSKLNRGVAY